jgi:hypothetical protein
MISHTPVIRHFGSRLLTYQVGHLDTNTQTNSKIASYFDERFMAVLRSGESLYI